MIKLPALCITVNNTELSSHEETRSQFNGGTGAIKLGIDVHQDFYVVGRKVRDDEGVASTRRACAPQRRVRRLIVTYTNKGHE